MKKHLIAAAMAIVMCLAVLSGCSVVKVFEDDLQVALMLDGELYGTYTVNIFNNAVVAEPEKEGYQFKGWSPKEDWTEGTDSEDLILPNTGLIRYDDVKDYVAGDSDSVTLYATFTAIPKRDLVIAWYNKEGTSGLNQSYMDAFETNMKSYLTTQGYTPESMDIVIRGYEGDVGTSCSAMKKDGDVDIMVGWAATSNLVNTGGLVEGVDFLQNVSGITIGAKSRYVARCTSTDLSKLIFVWIQTEYGSGEVVQPVDPDPTPDNPDNPDNPIVPERTPITLPDVGEAATSNKLKIAWYAKSATSGIDEAAMTAFKTKLEEYLTSQGYNLSSLEITIKGYEGTVEPSCAEILEDGDVDIMVGWAANIGTTGKLVEGTDYIVNVSGITIGTSSRYAAWLTNTDISKLAFTWILEEYGNYTVTKVEEPDPTPDPAPATTYNIVVAWYNNSKSGLDETTMAAFKEKLEIYLTAQNYDLSDVTITIRAYDGKVGESCSEIKKAGDVDIMVGWAATDNLVNTGGLVEGVDFLENVGGITIGSVERYTARLTDTELCKLVYNWIQSEYGAGEEEPDPTPDPDPVETYTLIVAWYNLESTTGLNETIIANFESALKTYLTSQGYDLANVSITLRAYDNDVATSCGNILTDGDVDIMLGWGKNLTTTGGISPIENVSGISMGGKSRYITLLTETELAKLVFDWIQTDEGLASLVSVAA